MIGRVGDTIAVEQPGVSTRRRVAMPFTQVSRAMLHGPQVRGIAEPAIRHRIVENETRAADQVTGMRVVDAAVIPEKMKKSAVRIDRARMVERHRVADMVEQEAGVAEVGHDLRQSTDRG